MEPLLHQLSRGHEGWTKESPSKLCSRTQGVGWQQLRSLWPPAGHCMGFSPAACVDGGLALGPSQEGALVLYSFICPRSLVLWVPEHTAVPLFQDSQIKGAGLAVLPLYSGPLHLKASTLPISLFRVKHDLLAVFSPSMSPPILILLHLAIRKCQPPQLALTPRYPCLSRDSLLGGWVGS